MPRHPAKRVAPIREPLSVVLGSHAKVSTLRVLATSTELLTQREVARRASLQHRTVQLALEELVALGLVLRTKGTRDFLVHLNRDHQLAAALDGLFRAEAHHFSFLRREIRNALLGDWIEDSPANVTAFGGAARVNGHADAGMGLVIVAANVAEAEEFAERVVEKRDEIERHFGVDVRPIAYSLRQARAAWRERRGPLREAHRDGIVLLGKPLAEIMG